MAARKMYALWKSRRLFAQPAKLLRVFRDSRTPTLACILPIVALAYIFFPFDILPDFIPLLGQFDDITIALSLVYAALKMVPEEVFTSLNMEVPRM